jgi:VanZ family protein
MRGRAGWPSLWLPVAAYMAMLFWFSSQPTLPPLPGQLSPYYAHATAYCGLSLLIVRALAGADLRRVTWLIAAGAATMAALYGVSDEYHQRFVPGRTFDVLDMAANGIGAFAGAIGVRAWGMIFIKMRDDAAA